jgi:hypothetical protein
MNIIFSRERISNPGRLRAVDSVTLPSYGKGERSRAPRIKPGVRREEAGTVPTKKGTARRRHLWSTKRQELEIAEVAIASKIIKDKSNYQCFAQYDITMVIGATTNEVVRNFHATLSAR